MTERKKFIYLVLVFLFAYWVPFTHPRVQMALLEAFLMLREYAREHVLLCLVPAFFIAGGIAVFISQAAVVKYFGAEAKKILSYGVASVSGTILAVCSCTVLPLFASIYQRGAGIGPAVAFLYSGPAINVLAIILTARVLGVEMGLARAVGAEGRVFGFDVQAAALEQTRQRLDDHGLAGRAALMQEGHEHMDRHLPTSVHGTVGGITFNLGYLPGSSSDRTTTPDTTIPALDASLQLLRPGGVVTVVLYTGHEGGAVEAQAVDEWAAALSQERAHALSYQFVNQRNDPPRLVAVEKRTEPSP